MRGGGREAGGCADLRPSSSRCARHCYTLLLGFVKVRLSVPEVSILLFGWSFASNWRGFSQGIYEKQAAQAATHLAIIACAGLSRYKGGEAYTVYPTLPRPRWRAVGRFAAAWPPVRGHHMPQIHVEYCSSVLTLPSSQRALAGD